MLMPKDEVALFAAERREEVISKSPFRVRRVVRWAECDPAGVVYTGNFSEYLLSAAHLFRRHLFNETWRKTRENLGVDTPNKAISMVFNGSLWPDDIFDVEVRVGEVRNRTFDFDISAFRADDRSSIFTGRLAVICVKADDRRVSLPIPDSLRRKLEAARSSLEGQQPDKQVLPVESNWHSIEAMKQRNLGRHES